MSRAPGGPEGAVSYALDGRAVDRADFNRVACDPLRSVAVEACAGSGKTWLLVSRMLRALLAPVFETATGRELPVEPHQILAITFTKKAAGEMRRRLNELLAQCIHAGDAELVELLRVRGVDARVAGQRLPEVRATCTRALVAGRPVQVRTIHGWFAALLRSAPLMTLQDLGLPPDHALLEDDAQAVTQFWPRLHRALHSDPGARDDFMALVATHGRQKIRTALEAALSKRLEFALADQHDGVADAVLHFTQQFETLAGLDEPEDLLWRAGATRDTLLQAAQNLGRASAATFSGAGVDLQDGLAARDHAAVWGALFTKEGSARKFSAKVQGLDQVRQAQQAVQALQQAREQHEAWGYHQRMTRLTRIMVREFAEFKRERAWVDMTDLERAALHLLDDPVLSGSIQERLDASLRHLLIDEFQDTSPLQWKALHAWLSSYGGAAGQAPRVFIVGDPKQSIYRFRGAAPRVFAAAQEFMHEAMAGALLTCDHTWRNARAVVAAVNGVMATAQATGEGQGFRPHSTESTAAGAVLRLPLVERPPRASRAPGSADREDGVAGLGTWRDSLSTARLLPEEKLRALECRQAAAWVSARMAQGAEPGEIMVLARKRDRLVAMQDALREAGIACEQPERTDLVEHCEVQDILALVDALVSPGHDLSLARALKSPLFGVSDEDLVDLVLQQRSHRQGGAGGPQASWFDLICSPDQQTAGWVRIGDSLRRWRHWLDQLPCHDALVAIYEDGAIVRRFAQVAPVALRTQVSANLQALLAVSLELDGGRYATPYALVRRMRRGGVRVAGASASNAVRLLTIHGAKGLEADLVLLLDCDAPASERARPGVLLDWPIDRTAPRRLAFLLDEQKPPACCAAEFAVEQAARRREELNALYVAMTRARHELVLSGLQNTATGGLTWWTQLASLATPLGVPVGPTRLGGALDGRETDLLPGASGAAPPQAAAHAHVEPLRLRTLPEFRVLTREVAGRLPDDDAIADDVQPDSRAEILGRAMHRLLELWPLGGTETAPDMLRRCAMEYDLDAPALSTAAALATQIANGAGAWAWDPSKVDWWKNELDIVHGGRLLRIDRLVRLRDTGQWWVLDYKSSGDSLSRPHRVEQLALYREAVCHATPGQQVRAAFLGGDGSMEILH